MTKQKHFLATGLKITICLIAILTILYAQAWVESFGWSYGGSLHTQIVDSRSDVLSDSGGFDLSTTTFNPYPFYPWNATQGKAMVLILALLIGLNLWLTLWAAPRRRERLLAAELRPMSRLVDSPARRPTLKLASGKKHKRRPNGAPAWH